VNSSVLCAWIITKGEDRTVPVLVSSKLCFEDDSIGDLAEAKVGNTTLDIPVSKYMNLIEVTTQWA
jgi:hypothetical protein